MKITDIFLSLISQFFGKLDMPFKTLLMVIVLDVITGLIKAFKNKNLDSIIGIKGILKKIGYLIIVSLSVIVDKIMGATGTIRNVVIYFFVANEGLSILENWQILGLPLPNKLYNLLRQFKEKEDN